MKQNTDNKRLFGQMIKKERLAKSLGLRQFAKKVSISATYLSRIENALDYPPSGRKITGMAEVLGIDSGVLFEAANKTFDAFEQEKQGDTKRERGRMPPEIYETYRQHAKRVPEFFRMVKKRKLTDKEWKTLIEKLKEKSND